MMDLAYAEAAKEGALIAVGIGSPGRFANDGTIKPGTNNNVSSTPGVFDNVNLKQEYVNSWNALHGDTPLHIEVGNDGNAMLAGMVEAIQKSAASGLSDQSGNEVGRFSLRNKHVALFGIGTGIGHAIAKVDSSGAFSFVTDGHASKLRIKIDDEDWPMIEKMKERAAAVKPDPIEVVTFDDHTVRAEDLFRGPTVNLLANVTDGRNINSDNPEHSAALQFAGKYMARTVALIKSGESTDVEPANGWKTEDKAEAAKTSMYLVGGGMGGSPLGKAIIAHAKTELDKMGISDVQLVQVPGENVAARAAATTVPASVYQTGRALS